MGRYALADHVFACRDGEHVVLLDLAEDRYWALEAARTAGLPAIVDGWPVCGADSVNAKSAPSAETAAMLDVLLERRLLTTMGLAGQNGTPVRARQPLTELVGAADSAVGVSASLGFKCAVACGFAKFAMRFLPFARVIRRVRRRKTRAGASAASADLQQMRNLVEAFMRFRVFLFSSKDACLYDSLALLEFLGSQGVYPDWVFGVRTRPFAAHCWVQYEGVVFNDTVEYVRGYTPIMVV